MIASYLGTYPLIARTVIDKTGLAGQYAFQLDLRNAGNDPFAAIEDQLGLKLVSGKAPVEFLVVDRIEKASEN